MWFVLNLFFCTGERVPPHLDQTAPKDTSEVFSVATPRKCCEPENKRKCTKPERQRMSDDLMDLNDRWQWYNANDASNKSNEDFML